MTDITELEQSLKAAAGKATKGQWVAFTDTASRTFSVHTPDDYRCGDVIKWAGFDGQCNAKANAEFIAMANPANILALVEALEKAQQTTAVESEPVGEVIEVGSALLVEWHKNLEEGTKLYTSPQAPIMPLGLHPDTQKLVTDFCTALAEKLYKAQLKYGYDTDWKQDGWPSQCQAHFHQHIAKGDPRDVAAYCAFMWWHGWSTKPAEGVESRTVTVKLPDYRNTYKSPFADEVEHQVRLALELFSS
ncbi:TPA: ead/Ea22-like family protein, partial [Klebsiella michiganensis]